jgi:hypothetical protein
MSDADLITRVADLEVTVDRLRLSSDILSSRYERLEGVVERLISGTEPVADARLEKENRQRVLAAYIAEASGLGLSWMAAKRVANIIAGHCRAPAGCDEAVAQLRLLFSKPPCQMTIWRRLRDHSELIRLANSTNKWPC